MDPQGQILSAQEQDLEMKEEQYEDSKDPLLNSSSLQDSDSSFSLADEGRNLKKLSLKGQLGDQDINKIHRSSKHGLKYARISNDQREALIQRVTSTGCTIKSAALDLGINFSTAKAIMQIFKKEGRSCKKVIRKNKKKRSFILQKKYSIQPDETNSKKSMDHLNQSIQSEKQVIKQEYSFLENDKRQQGLDHQLTQLEDLNRKQQQLIEQLNNQNFILQGQINGLQQEKIVLLQKYQQIAVQYTQMQNMMSQMMFRCQQPF